MYKKFLVEEISGICKQNTSKEAILYSLANLFKITVDKIRLCDYKIIKIDLEKLSLEILDTKTSTTLTSIYSPYSEVLGCAYPDNDKLFNYINVTYVNNVLKRKSIYNVSNDTLMLERITIRNNEYGLCFERTMPNVVRGFKLQDGTQFLIKYFKEVEEDDEYKKETREYDLLASLYKTNYLKEKHSNFLNRLFVYDNQETQNKNMLDQFCFGIDENIVVGSKFRNAKRNINIEGACFEKIDKKSLTKATYSPTCPIKNYSNFDISSVESAILYAGFNYPNEENIYYHNLEIVKIDNKLKIKYIIEDYSKYNPSAKCCPSVKNVKFEISNLSFGNIAISEINIIIKYFQREFKDNQFIVYIINELEIFKNKLKIKNGLLQEEQCIISPKLLFDKTFDEIEVLASSNKDMYFNLISEQFKSVVNIDKSVEKKKIKILKTN